MQGILSGGQPPQAQGAQSAQPQEAEQQPANPQQSAKGTQEQYDVVSGQMLNYLYSDPGMDAFKTALSTQDPAAGMANMLGRLMVMSAQSATLAGKKIPPKVLFQSGMETARAMSELGQKAGVLTKETEAQIVEDAFYNGVSMFAQEATEEALTPSDREQYAQLLDMLEQMEQKNRGGAPQQQAPEQQQGQQPAQQMPQGVQ